ncbi:methionine--tRNA ligase subunit beta, partial [bacterium]|nr:methionine--tRNA ligase subunit beta [bacterium]
LTASLEAFRLLVLYLKPVMPKFASKTEASLKTGNMDWSNINSTLENRQIEKLPHLATRTEKESIDKMTEETIKENAVEIKEKTEEKAEISEIEPIAPECTIDDFAKIDLRVGYVKKAEHVEGAKKLLHLIVDIGGGIEKNIFAGIKSAYNPEQLEGTQVVIVANLQPRKMKFGMSEGMVVAAGPGGSDIFVLRPDNGAKPGDRIH